MKRTSWICAGVVAVVLLLITLPTVSSALSLDDTLALYWAGEYRVAAERLERLKQESPDTPLIRFYLGYAYYKLRDFERSRAEFLELYEMEPKFSPPVPNR